MEQALDAQTGSPPCISSSGHRVMPTFSKENAYLSVKLKMAFCFECGRNFPLTQDEIDALQRWSEAED